VDASVVSFGTRATGTVASNTAVAATTDLFITVYADLAAINKTLALYKCDSDGGNAVTLDIVESDYSNAQRLSVSGCIKSGEYWKAVAANLAAGAINYVIMPLS